MSVATKRVDLNKVQAIAAQYVFVQLAEARNEFDVAQAKFQVVENRCKAQFAEVLKDAGIDQKHVGDAAYESGPNGAYVEYAEEVADPVFEKPPAAGPPAEPA